MPESVEQQKKAGLFPSPALIGVMFYYRVRGVGHALRKEVMPMKHFLRDVLAGFLASVLAAVAVHLMNL